MKRIKSNQLPNLSIEVKELVVQGIYSLYRILDESTNPYNSFILCTNNRIIYKLDSTGTVIGNLDKIDSSNIETIQFEDVEPYDHEEFKIFKDIFKGCCPK